MYKNLTPHDINLMDTDGNTLQVVPKSGMVARIDSTKGEITNESGFPVEQPQQFTEPYTLASEEFAHLFDGPCVDHRFEGLPKPEGGVFYLVGLLVGTQCPRKDIYRVGTDDPPKWMKPDHPDYNYYVVRNENGHIKGVRRLIRTM